MQPHLTISFPAILSAAFAAFLLGWLWYGPLFGRTWGKLMGMKMDKKPEAAFMIKALGFQFLGLFLTSYVLAHSGQIWRPTVWGAATDGGSNAAFGFMAGVFTWIGFYIPQQLSKVNWEMRPWKLFFINAGHDFVALQVIAQILAHWR